MKELRIYFESLEQAAHFIGPILEQTQAFKEGFIGIKLIKLTGNFALYSKHVAPIVYLKDPDILITVIEDDIEYPLFQLEISTAVFTEDHELQRFDGIVASVENNCIYGKLSPLSKTSQSPHGGNTQFNYHTSYKVIYEKFGIVAFHFDWPCDSNGNVIINNEYLSCPREIPSLSLFLHHLSSFIAKTKVNASTWLDQFQNNLLKERIFANWVKELKKSKLPDPKTLNSSRTEWKEKSKEIHLKINRFGHAMDPERGMLAYYGTICENTLSKMCFDETNEAWYKDTPKETTIKNYIMQNGLCCAYDFLHCFILGSGLHANADFKKIAEHYEDNNSDNLTIDLSKFLVDNFGLLNKPLRTIFKFSKEFHIFDKEDKTRLKLIWSTINTENDFSAFPSITAIQRRTLFDEDDVTYICVHNILSQNGYKIIAVSYPGAQGDRVVLAEAGTGRKQQRRYIDIVSYLPKSHSALQENKAQFSVASIQAEINELSKYKTDKAYKKSIENLLLRFEKQAPKSIKIGVGFWATSKFKVQHIQQIEIDSLDYFVYIKANQKDWVVFGTGRTKMFSTTTGKVRLPKFYEVLEDSTNQLSVFEADE